MRNRVGMSRCSFLTGDVAGVVARFAAAAAGPSKGVTGEEVVLVEVDVDVDAVVAMEVVGCCCCCCGKLCNTGPV